MALWYLGENHTADNVMVADSDDGLLIALIERRDDPFKGCYAFPGGFVDTYAKKGEPFRMDWESPKDAALREMKEEVNVVLEPDQVNVMAEIGFYDDPNRDPRNTKEAWVVSTAFLIHLTEPFPLTAGDDAATAQWLPLQKVLSNQVKLAFDHAKILQDAIAKFQVFEPYR